MHISYFSAPAVSLAGIGVGEGKKMTCYPALKDKLTASGKYTFVDEKVVIDGKMSCLALQNLCNGNLQAILKQSTVSQ